MRLLGLVPEQALVDLVDLIAQGEPGELLRRIDALAESGQDMHGLLDSLLGHLRLIYLLQHADALPESEAAAPDRIGRAGAPGARAAARRDRCARSTCWRRRCATSATAPTRACRSRSR